MDFQVTIALLLLIFTEKTDSASRCLSYPDPKNGYVTCDSLFHLFCSPECHPGFRFATKPAVVYMCGPVTGEWFTYPVGSGLPWPDCIPEDRSDDTIHDELAKKREEMTQYITDKHTGIPTPYSQAKRIDPEERYHHLFDYIERAQKAYEYREAIDKETEKLKQENVAAKENTTETQNNSYKSHDGPYEASSTPSKIPLSYANGFVTRKDSVSQSGFPKGDLPKQSLFAQNAQILHYNQSTGYNNHLPLATNTIPAIIDRGNGFSRKISNVTEKLRASSSQPNLQAGNVQLNSARPIIANTVDKKITPFKQNTHFVLNGFSRQSNVTEKLRVSSSQPNLQAGNFQLNSARSNIANTVDKKITPFKQDTDFVLNGFAPQKSKVTEKLRVSSSQPNLQAGNFQLDNSRPNIANTVDKKISPFKQDTDFVRKMLNNEEFKDLHYLDEHVRLNRGAPTSLNKNSTKGVLQNDKGVRRNTSDNDHYEHLSLSSGESKDDLRDNFTGKANKEAKEHENMSGYVEPIVMSRTSLIDSLFKKLNDSTNANMNTNRSSLNSQRKEKQQIKITKFENKTFDFPQNFSSMKNNGHFSRKNSNFHLNLNRQNILGSPDVQLNSSNNTMKQMYKSWLKKHESSINSYANEQRRKNISSQTNPLPRTRVNSLTAQNVNNVAAKKSRQNLDLKSSRGRDGSEIKKQTVQEHIFYFPIKKDTLFEILNETNLIPKS